MKNIKNGFLGMMFLLSSTLCIAQQWTTYTTSNCNISGTGCKAIHGNALNSYIFVGHYGSGLDLFDVYNNSWGNYNISNSTIGYNYISTIEYGSNGLYLGLYGLTGMGYSFAMTPNQYNSYSVTNVTSSGGNLPDNDVLKIKETSQYRWFCTKGGGVSQRNMSTSIWNIFNTSNSGLASDNVFDVLSGFSLGSMYYNADYFATSNGVSINNGGIWTTYNTSNSSLIDNTVCQIASGNGKLYIGSYNIDNGIGGINIFDGTTWQTFTSTNSDLAGNYIKAIEVDPCENVWVGTTTGLSVFQGTAWITYNTSNSPLPDDYVNDIYIEVLTGDVWIATNGGVAKIHFPKSFYVDHSSLNIGSENNSTATFNLSTNVQNWEISTNATWLTDDQPSSIYTTCGNKDITLTASANTTSNPRSTTVTISDPSGVASSVNVFVTQQGASSIDENSYFKDINIVIVNGSTIKYNGFPSSCEFKIFDSQARLIKANILSSNEGTIDFSDLPFGIYFIEFNLDGHRLAKKFIRN